MKNGNEPAFAAMNEQEVFLGLTKREYFAAQAMNGILANTLYAKGLEGNNWQPAHGEVGKFAVEMADELLIALGKTEA